MDANYACFLKLYIILNISNVKSTITNFSQRRRAYVCDYRRTLSKSSTLCHRDDQLAVCMWSYLHTRDRALFSQ